MIRIRALVAGALLGGCVATAAIAQTTGAIVGRVDVKTGGGLPMVLVEAKGPALQGSRTATTDGSGRYRLALLPPGAYDLTFTKQGFATETRKGVVVQLARDLTIDVALAATMEEQVLVTGEGQAIETGSSTLGANLDSRAIESIPTGRNYSSILRVAPGVSDDISSAANPSGDPDQTAISVYGSSGAENSYYIDGVNTTGIEYGFEGKKLNYEFIEAVDVKTGGYEAEYGKSTGGVVNVITKSGSNQFHGDVFGYYDADSLQSSAKATSSPTGTVASFTRQDFGFDVGGPIVKDKLWYFVAYDRVDNTTNRAQPVSGTEIPTDTTRDLASAKLTWQIAANHQLQFTYFQDPQTNSGAIIDGNHTLNGTPPTYLGDQKFGGEDYAIRYQGILGPRWILTAQAARHGEQNSQLPATSAGNQIQYRDAGNNFAQTGGFGLIQTKDFSRDMLTVAASAAYGPHEIKFGGEYEEENADVVKRMSGGQRVDVVANTVNPLLPIYVHNYWTTPNATVANAPVSQLNASPKHKITSLFVQDGWAVRSDLTWNFGLRWDRQQIIDASGVAQIDLRDDFAPRLGFAWDPTHDHKSKVFASFGYYYEQLPMDLVIRSFSYERQPRIVNYDPVSVTPDANAESAYGTPSAILGGFTEPSDPHLKGQYLSEFILGGEREFAPDWVIGAKGIYREYRRVIEDFLCVNDGTYCIGNPGHGIMKQIFTLDYSTTYAAPKPKRQYKGIQIDVTKRFSKNWQMLASYVWSKLDGNFDGEFAPFTNVGADPNISAAYDYYDFFTNGSDLTKITNNGALSNDRRHQFKFAGVYVTPVKLQIGWFAYWRTGTPLSRYGYSDAYGRYEFFLTNRGSEGRNPDDYEADLHLAYPLEIKKKVTINFMLDVFSLLDAQRPVLLDQRWGFQEADNASPTPVNPSYGDPILRTRPRAARLGLRVSF
jgi:outer membrane receptor for ferrienterochelin and colicin